MNFEDTAMSQSNRRGFLKLTGALSTAAATGTTFARNTPNKSERMLLRSDFLPLLGSHFEIATENAAHSRSSIRLIAIEDLPHCTNEERSFRLVFQPQTISNTPHQNTWKLSHQALGVHDVFLSPNDTSGTEIEAVFNRG